MSTRTERFEVAGTVEISVALLSGSVTVEDGAAGMVLVEVSGRRPDEFLVERRGTRIDVRLDDRRVFGDSHDVRIVAPAGSGLVASLVAAGLRCETAGTIEARSVAGDLSVGRVTTSARLQSASGDVEIGVSHGSVTVATASGDVRGGTLHGDVTATTAAGDVRLAEVDGDLEVTTASGDVTCGRIGGDVTGRSVSGDLGFDRVEGSAARIKTMSGNIRLGLPPGIDVDVDLVTRTGRVRVPDERTGDPGAERRTVTVSARSFSGDIELVRAPG